MFDLAADPAAIGAHLSQRPGLAPLVAARPGLRVPGAWDGFELAVRAMLGQQITVAAARGLAGKLVADLRRAAARALARRGPDPWPSPPRSAWRRPTSPASACPARGPRRCRPWRRAVAADPALFGPRAQPRGGGRAAQGPAGIGEWTAQYIAMRELREPDAFPAADIGLMRALADADGVRPTPAELLARAEAWRPWRAYAALHLWTADSARAHPSRGDRPMTATAA